MASQQQQEQQQQQQKDGYEVHEPSIKPASRSGSDAVSQAVPLGAIAAMTLCMALASGLGAVPFFFVGALSCPWAGMANAVASGVMLAASFGLIQEGSPYSGPYTVAGILLGALFIKISQQYLDRWGAVTACCRPVHDLCLAISIAILWGYMPARLSG